MRPELRKKVLRLEGWAEKTVLKHEVRSITYGRAIRSILTI